MKMAADQAAIFIKLRELEVFQENGQSQQDEANQDEPEGKFSQHGEDSQFGKQADQDNHESNNKGDKFWCRKFHDKLLLR